MKRIGITSVLLLSVATLAACSTNSAPVPASSSATSPNSSTASASAADQVDPTPSASPAAFLQTNCAAPQYNQKLDAAPTDSVELNGVYEKTDPQGVPVVTIGEGLPPATDLATLDLTEGTGKTVKAGDTITFDYCGIGQTTRGMFDSSWSRGKPLSYPLDQLIPGWQEGIPGMKEGGSRLLIIPGALAYGENPPAGIMPNETLVFVVSVKSIDK